MLLAAQPVNPWMEEARELVAQFRFADAIERLEVAKKVPGLAGDELHAVLGLLAYCQLAEGRRADAEATWVALLQDDPEFEPARETSSPKVLEAFATAKKRLFPADYVHLEEEPAPAGRAAVKLVDPWNQVQLVTLWSRRDGADWHETPLTAEGRRYFVALQIAAGESLEWYVEASGGQRVLASVATRSDPRQLLAPRIEVGVVPEPEPVGVNGRRIAGVIAIGLGIAAGAVGAGLEVNGWNTRLAARDRSKPPGDFADTALRAEADGAAQQTWATGLFIGAGVALAGGIALAW